MCNEKSYILDTQSYGGDGDKRNITEVPTAQKSDGGVAYKFLITILG